MFHLKVYYNPRRVFIDEEWVTGEEKKKNTKPSGVFRMKENDYDDDDDSVSRFLFKNTTPKTRLPQGPLQKIRRFTHNVNFKPRLR